MRSVARALLPLVASVLFACGSGSSAAGSSAGGSSSAAGSSAGGSSAGGAASGVCVADMRAQTYAPGLEVVGAMSVFRVRLVRSDPAPPIKGSNDWVVEIVDAAGAPVVGATVTAKPFMPDHGHGSSVVPSVTEMGAGRYQIASLVLFMPGLWQTTIAVTTAGAADSAVFAFCVPG